MAPSYYVCTAPDNNGARIDFTKIMYADSAYETAYFYFAGDENGHASVRDEDAAPAMAAYDAYLQQRDEREEAAIAHASDMAHMLERISHALEMEG